jgi:tetratricopeptide (TPR) repeat protein
MIGLCRTRFSIRRTGLVVTVLVCGYAFLAPAETPKPIPDPTSLFFLQEPPAAQVSYAYTLSPEEQGDILMARRSYVAAIQAYQHGSLRSPVLWNKIGIAYHHMFALDEARKDYQMALSLNPHYADALNNLAAVYHGKGDYKKAEKTYKKALKYAPRNAITYCNLGTSYFAEKKYKQGTRAYQQAFALDPEVFNPDGTAKIEESSTRQQRVAINFYLAKTYATAGKNDQALACLRKALDAGFNDRKRLMEDKDFALLRTTPEFHQLMMEQHLN